MLDITGVKTILITYTVVLVADLIIAVLLKVVGASQSVITISLVLVSITTTIYILYKDIPQNILTKIKGKSPMDKNRDGFEETETYTIGRIMSVIGMVLMFVFLVLVLTVGVLNVELGVLGVFLGAIGTGLMYVDKISA